MTQKEATATIDIALCAHVQEGKVRYCKEYTLRGRVIGTEYIPYSEFVRLLNRKAE